MDQTRRNVLKAGGGASLLALLAAAGMLRPEAALAADWNQKAFDAKNLKDAFEALGAGGRVNSADIVMTAPEIAENGAVVPIGVTSKLPGTESIAILVANNPNPLAASFDIPAGTEPGVTTRVKMAETSEVHVLVKAQGKYYVTKKEIKVTIGGCGG
jgi:sulfur-oxidizing protein SoxY